MIDSDKLPTIPANRVVLRWLENDDVESLFSIFSHREVARYWSSPPLPSLAHAKELLTEIRDCFEKKSLFQWGVARADNNLIVGTCTLASLDPSNRRAEVGFALGHAHWGQGYITEALTALFHFAFNELNLHRIEADVDPRNAASIKALERLGFQREGHLRERWIVNGEIQDALYYGLLAREWVKRSPKPGDNTR